MFGLIACGSAVLLIGSLLGVGSSQTLFVAFMFVLAAIVSLRLVDNKLKMAFRFLVSLATAAYLLPLPVFAVLGLSSVGSISYILLSVLISALSFTFDSIVGLTGKKDSVFLLVVLIIVLVAAIFLPRDILVFVAVAMMVVSVVAVVQKSVSNLVSNLY